MSICVSSGETLLLKWLKPANEEARVIIGNFRPRNVTLNLQSLLLYLIPVTGPSNPANSSLMWFQRTIKSGNDGDEFITWKQNN